SAHAKLHEFLGLMGNSGQLYITYDRMIKGHIDDAVKVTQSLEGDLVTMIIEDVSTAFHEHLKNLATSFGKRIDERENRVEMLANQIDEVTQIIKNSERLARLK